MTTEELEARQDEILYWLLDRPVTHPEYEDKIKDLHDVEAQLFVKNYRKPSDTQSGGIEECSIPKNIR